MIVIILGPDAGLAHGTLKRVLADRDPSGQNTSVLDGNSVGIRAVMNDISSVGFFASGRVVVVENLLARLGKRGARDAGNAPAWAALYASVPAANTLVLFDPSITELGSLAKAPLPKEARTEYSRPPRGPQLIEWIQETASAAGSNIARQSAQHLAMRLFPQGWASEPKNPTYDRPPDMELLTNEIAKLVTAAYPGEITNEIINDLSAAEQDDHIFTFLDAAASGNIPDALREMDKLIANGEEPAKLLAQLGSTMELATPVAAAGRRPSAAIASDISGLAANRVNVLQRSLQGMSPAVAMRRTSVVASADRRLKTGQIKTPEDELYEVIVGIASMRQQARGQR